jgi:DNA-binding transcriptional LysR family regulator
MRRAVTLVPPVFGRARPHLPQARWIAANAARNDERIATVHVNDAEAVLEAVIAGLGRSLLPCIVADGDSRLRRIGLNNGPVAALH